MLEAKCLSAGAREPFHGRNRNALALPPLEPRSYIKIKTSWGMNFFRALRRLPKRSATDRCTYAYRVAKKSCYQISAA